MNSFIQIITINNIVIEEEEKKTSWLKRSGNKYIVKLNLKLWAQGRISIKKILKLIFKQQTLKSSWAS
jgi:hypothetical protein